MDLRRSFDDLATPQIADACIRLDVALLVAPAGLRPVVASDRIAGPVLPARHYGSVDIFFEAFETAKGGEILVIDNQGRADEACIGDLTVIEARAAGLAGMMVWGVHRDNAELERLGFPVFSYGTCPAGPVRLDPPHPDALVTARFGKFEVTRDHVVFADGDGAVFVPATEVEPVLTAARSIRKVEIAQADLVSDGETLRDQLGFGDYLEKRRADPTYTLRKHLRAGGGAIEE